MIDLTYCHLGKETADVHCFQCAGWGIVYKKFYTLNLLTNREIRQICPSCQKTGTAPISFSEVL